MRLAGLCLCIVVFASCKNKGDTESAPDPAAIKAQQDLVARRDALLAQRDMLQGESTKLQEEIVKVAASGGDITELEKKKKDIDSQLESQNTNLDSTASELDKISSKLDAAGGVAAREARVAEREARVADREKAAMNKMQQLMELESKNAEKWKEGCAVGGGTTTVIQQIAPPKSGNYNRKEVDALMGKAKKEMGKKGLLNSDLGAQAALESEITKALQESDWTRGYILASQLVQTIDGITVNRNFIKAKYDRLQSRVKQAKPEASVNAQLEAGMGEVMQKYGDGDFSAANRKINQLYGLLR
ncbi:MAG: hypothetical protein ACKV2T_26590 [Kofleriaceae bacterium]